jgi:hypothetical protein
LRGSIIRRDRSTIPSALLGDPSFWLIRTFLPSRTVLAISTTCAARKLACLARARISPEIPHQSGSCVAQAILGMHYLFGADSQFNVDSVAVDYEKAFRYLSMAAQQGASRAIANLGYMYLRGLWVPRDIKRAIQLFEEVGKVEFHAALDLARIYARGIDVPLDRERAHEWYSVVAGFENEEFNYDALSEELDEAKAYLAGFDGEPKTGVV